VTSVVESDDNVADNVDSDDDDDDDDNVVSELSVTVGSRVEDNGVVDGASVDDCVGGFV